MGVYGLSSLTLGILFNHTDIVCQATPNNAAGDQQGKALDDFGIGQPLRMAKMKNSDNVRRILTGLLFAVVGVAGWFAVANMEKDGAVFLPCVLMPLYALGGKWLIAGVPCSIGVLAGVSGIIGIIGTRIERR